MKLNAFAIGRLGRNSDAKYTQAGKPMTTFSIATNPYWGDRKKDTVWVDCVCFGKLAEIAAQYLTKGMLVYIDGVPSARAWMPKDGSDEPRSGLSIVVDNLKMLGGGEEAESNPQPAEQQESAEPPPGPSDELGDTLNLDEDEDFF